MNTIKKEILTKGILKAIYDESNNNQYIWDHDNIKWHIYNKQLFKATSNSITILNIETLGHEEIFFLSTWTSKLNELNNALSILLDTINLFIKADELILTNVKKTLLKAQILNKTQIKSAFYKEFKWNSIEKYKLETMDQYQDRLKKECYKQLLKYSTENTVLKALKVYKKYDSFYHELEGIRK